MNVASMPEAVISGAFHSTSAGHSIGSMLIDAGRITPESAENILKLQKEKGLRFGEAAIQLGLISQDELQHCLSRQFDYPYLLAGDTRISKEVIAAFEPFSPAVEQLRGLRSQLMLRELNPDSPNRSLAVISPDSSEGRSNLAANLAVVFSQLGENVLLIDADLRKPRQHELFCLGNQPGLSAVLSGRVPVADAICRITSLLGLSVLPAGAVPPNPQELLARPTFESVLTYSRHKYDIAIIDTPAGNTADATMTASRAGAALVIVRKNFTFARRLQELTSSLRRVGTVVVGMAVTDF